MRNEPIENNAWARRGIYFMGYMSGPRMWNRKQSYMILHYNLKLATAALVFNRRPPPLPSLWAYTLGPPSGAPLQNQYLGCGSLRNRLHGVHDRPKDVEEEQLEAALVPEAKTEGGKGGQGLCQ